MQQLDLSEVPNRSTAVNSAGLASARRDAAMHTLRLNREFMRCAEAAVRRALRTSLPNDFTGEDLRLAVIATGIKAHTPRAWGALIMHLMALSVIEQTGTWRPMREARSHARRTPVYRRGWL